VISRTGFAFALAAALAGCGHAAPPATAVVFHSLGSRQCEPGGLSPEELAGRLRDAGVEVRSIACGHDGRMRPAMCGAPDGRVAVFEIAAAQLETALAQGFQDGSGLPPGPREACR
jgi:hypothetical protein